MYMNTSGSFRNTSIVLLYAFLLPLFERSRALHTHHLTDKSRLKQANSIVNGNPSETLSGQAKQCCLEQVATALALVYFLTTPGKV